MIVYSPHRIFSLRGIEKPYTFLRKYGFTHNKASSLARGDIKRMDFRDLTTLCELLNCYPHDLMKYKGSGDLKGSGSHLECLNHELEGIDYRGLIHKIPLEEFEEVERFLKEKGDIRRNDNNSKHDR